MGLNSLQMQVNLIIKCVNAYSRLSDLQIALSISYSLNKIVIPAQLQDGKKTIYFREYHSVDWSLMGRSSGVATTDQWSVILASDIIYLILICRAGDSIHDRSSGHMISGSYMSRCFLPLWDFSDKQHVSRISDGQDFSWMS